MHALTQVKCQHGNHHRHPSEPLLSTMSWDCISGSVFLMPAYLTCLRQRTWHIVVPLSKSVLDIDPNLIEIVNNVIGSVSHLLELHAIATDLAI